MKPGEFYIVDVFAEDKYAGNRLAVILYDRWMTDELMQKIALEFNFSETTFIMSDKEDKEGWTVRIFTPTTEVPFAGHPTLGTASVIADKLFSKSPKNITLSLGAGPIPVDIDKKSGILTMTQNEPVFGDTHQAENVAKAIGLCPQDIDSAYPIEEVSTGLPFFIVPLRSLKLLKQARTNTEAYFRLIKNTWAKAIMLFAPGAENPAHALTVRMFGEFYGITEDPATGSGNGSLCAWLSRRRYFETEDIDISVEQGKQTGRPSVLYLSACRLNGKTAVRVGGRVIETAKGGLVRQ